jgi:tripartite-type tricarboxylate transporter receptor subunit TctC
MQRRALLALAATPAFAQEAPIRIIVPYAAGGGSDTVARLLAGPMGGFLGTPLVVENRPGATGLIGTQQVARAAPDGLTLVLADTPHVINPHIHPQAGYDAVADFQPIAMVGTTPLLLVAHPGAGIDGLGGADSGAARSRRGGGGPPAARQEAGHGPPAHRFDEGRLPPCRTLGRA